MKLTTTPGSGTSPPHPPRRRKGLPLHCSAAFAARSSAGFLGLAFPHRRCGRRGPGPLPACSRTRVYIGRRHSSLLDWSACCCLGWWRPLDESPFVLLVIIGAYHAYLIRTVLELERRAFPYSGAARHPISMNSVETQGNCRPNHHKISQAHIWHFYHAIRNRTRPCHECIADPL